MSLSPLSIANWARRRAIFPGFSRCVADGLRLLPGLGLCALVTLVAIGLAAAEGAVFGRVWLDPLVLAILLGMVCRGVGSPRAVFTPGIAFGAKMLLEIAVALLGTTVSFRAIGAVGPALLLGIAGVVVVTIPASFLICRAFALPRRMAILVACGNSICGNSAIAAVAPVIGADGEDVAGAIAFTAVLGVLAVLGLPLLAAPLDLGARPFGILCGLTVYAVPQVLAAAAPAGLVAIQIGTLVKLVRVLMLGPVVLILSIIAAGGSVRALPPHRLVPWFVVAFLGLATWHSLGGFPQPLVAPTTALTESLTVLAMAGLGLEVDIRQVMRAGPRVCGAVTLSLLLLGLVALGLVHLLGES